MEQIVLEEDINVYYITASSFPESIQAAHESLHAIIPYAAERKYFGISFPDRNGMIQYKAGATAIDRTESKGWDLPAYIIKKGNYACCTIKNYHQHLSVIAETFQKLLNIPELDPQGACIEWYINNQDLKCMIRLKDK